MEKMPSQENTRLSVEEAHELANLMTAQIESLKGDKKPSKKDYKDAAEEIEKLQQLAEEPDLSERAKKLVNIISEATNTTAMCIALGSLAGLGVAEYMGNAQEFITSGLELLKASPMIIFPIIFTAQSAINSEALKTAEQKLEELAESAEEIAERKIEE